MSHVSTHVHDWDTSSVETVDNFLGRNTDRSYKESSLLGNNDIDQLLQLSSGVILVGLSSVLSSNLG